MVAALPFVVGHLEMESFEETKPENPMGYQTKANL